MAYVLRRIQTDPDVHYVMGWGTESFRRLCEAYAHLSGEPFAEIEASAKQTYFRANERRQFLSRGEWLDQLSPAARNAVEDAR